MGGVGSDLRVLLGLAPAERVEFRVADSVDAGDYVRERLEYVGDEGAAIPALLFKPTRRENGGGVVVYHQHNSEFHLGKSEVAGLVGDPRQAWGPALARRGVTVLAPDAVSFEDRRSQAKGIEEAEGDWLQHYNAMAYRLQNGDTLMRKCLDDAQRALGVMQAVLGAETAKVGVAGHSFGGALAMYHAAVDERCQFACVSGAVCSYKRRQARGTGIGMMEVVPGIAKRFEVQDAIAAIQPRPLLVVSSTEDDYAADANEVLLAAGLSEATTHVRERGGHALDDVRFAAIIDWLTKHATA
jgi:dienelactone hydrolase